jgi:hypothetical protein
MAQTILLLSSTVYFVVMLIHIRTKLDRMEHKYAELRVRYRLLTGLDPDGHRND